VFQDRRAHGPAARLPDEPGSKELSMAEKIIVVVLVVLAAAYIVRRYLRKDGSSCGCAGTSGSCCGGSRKDLKPMHECCCSKKS